MGEHFDHLPRVTIGPQPTPKIGAHRRCKYALAHGETAPVCECQARLSSAPDGARRVDERRPEGGPGESHIRLVNTSSQRHVRTPAYGWQQVRCEVPNGHELQACAGE